jgi:hypothetical protein
MSKRMSLGALVVLSCSVVACLAGSSDPTDDDTDSRARPIVGGTKATAFPEAVLVDMYQNNQLAAYCSGSLIAPKVVLTAGHCVFQFTKWVIRAPFASGQTANASSGATYDWTNTSESVNPNMHDLGLIFLDTPITLSSYPTLSTSKVADNTQIVNIGRINSGTLSTTALYVSSPITIVGASSSGFPYDYTATDKIESGDSGGPDELVGTHEIVSVNSGAGSGTEVLARVDLESAWIQQQIAAHGGSGSSSGSTSSTGSGSTGTGSGAGGSTGSSGGTGGSTGGSCSHSDCSSGTKLVASCDPCVQEICASDSYCCATKWDSQCVSEVSSICGKSTCGGSSTSTSTSTGSGSSSTGGSTDPCNGLTYSGECVGNTVEWCDGTPQKLKCSGGTSCGWNSSQGYYDCL